MREAESRPDDVPAPFGAGPDIGPINALMALSPLDGRYAAQVADLRRYFSEFALMRYRFRVEIEWLIYVLRELDLPGAPTLDDAGLCMLRGWSDEFEQRDAEAIKAHEQITRHDVKAVEYYIRELLQRAELPGLTPFVHLCCTSEDINNISHALMLRDGMRDVWVPALEKCVGMLSSLAISGASVPMVSRTHGQPASPTTIGKELAVFVARLRRQQEILSRQTYLAKFSGAVGNYNAHVAAYPDIDWPDAAHAFIGSFGLHPNPLTTQIEPHDYLAEIFQLIVRVNTIIIDLDRDVWSYISFGYLRQQVYAGEVGSSTMPHKVNPIDFENSEANAGVSNALLDHLALKLPVSRMQRDLSDSSAIRSIGTGIGHSLLSLKACIAGLDKIDIDAGQMRRDLEQNWAVMAEAIQTVLRKHGIESAYEQLKRATQNRQFDATAMRAIVLEAGIPEPDRSALLAMTPAEFIGLAPMLAMSMLEGGNG